MKHVLKEILSYVIIIVVVLLFKYYIMSPVRVTGTSMYPTLEDGDIMLLNEIGYRLNGVKRFDIVVCNYEGEKIIKRVIGMPGDKVEFKDNKLYINDEEVEQDFTYEITHNFELSEIGYDVIPDDMYFVVGDNRGVSKDSRIIGLMSKDQIMGKVIKTVIFPFKRIGNVK